MNFVVKMFWGALLIVLAICQSTGMENEYECPREFVLIDRKCYYFSHSASTWRDAYFNCRDKNAELALVKKKWQDKSLRTFLKTGQMGWVDRWIGGIYDWKRMVWVWGTNGQPLRYRGFGKRIRKNLSSGNHQWKCISMNPNFRYRWQPKFCTKELHYICETQPRTNLVTNDHHQEAHHHYGHYYRH